MPDILRIKTEDWELNVWCTDIKPRQRVLNKTLAARHALLPESSVRFSRSLSLKFSEPEHSDVLVFCPLQAVNELHLATPLFFENLQYQFEWVFTEQENVNAAEIQHKLKSVCASFRFSQRTGRSVLQGTIQTRNDIGWLRLPLQYTTGGQHKHIALSFEVFPVKMDLERDLPAMYQTVDEILPLWRFALAQKTEQESGKSRQQGHFPLLWMARFETLRQQLSDGLKLIANAPHSRLMPDQPPLKADRIKGRISPRLAEKIKQDQKTGLSDKHYRVPRKKLSIDTPENRFIKMVVDTTKARLEHLHKILTKANASPDNQVLSDAFLALIKDWQTPLVRLQTQSFYREVGAFSGLNGESLVLQQKTGYSAVYRVWQELKYYLDIFAQQDSISMKSIAEIYEIWCFLEIRRMLRDDLGFTETKQVKQKLSTKQLELTLTDGMAGAYQFTRADGIKLRLAHEPPFNKRNSAKQPIRVWTIPQTPDILLEARFANGQQFVWLFDAKYRIRPIKNDADDLDYEIDPNAPDLVPDDAINQMHRYRDALIYNHPQTKADKTRPIFGAFALYPGFFNQSDPASHNPYTEAINEVGIGAFALLPSASDENSGNGWLKSFLIEKLSLNDHQYSTEQMTECLFVQDAARIPYQGMKQVLYADLTLTVPLGSAKGRTKEYVENFANGTARWYHIPEQTFSIKYSNHIAKEICYLAVATIASGATNRTIKRVWRVKSAHLLERRFITSEQAGSTSTNNEKYWLFELCEPVTLENEITGVSRRKFKEAMKLTTFDHIAKTKVFNDIKAVYQGALV